MKKTLLLSALAFLMMTGLASAQKKDTLVNTKKNMISTDVNVFLGGPLKISNFRLEDLDINLPNIGSGLGRFAGSSYDPYLFLYRHFFNSKNAFRAGLGFKASIFVDDQNSQSDDLQLRSFSYNFGMGYEHDWILGRRSVLFAGADLTFASGTARYTSGSGPYALTTSGRGLKYGITPFVGYGYFITKSLSLSVQTNLMFFYSQQVMRTSYMNGNSVDRMSDFGFSLGEPFSVQLRWSIK